MPDLAVNRLTLCGRTNVLLSPGFSRTQSFHSGSELWRKTAVAHTVRRQRNLQVLNQRQPRIVQASS